jgi:3-oxoacyl-[acyl-carrier-protein] synthase-3
VLRHGGAFVERLWPGLSRGLGTIAWVVPHQASRCHDRILLLALARTAMDHAHAHDVARALQASGLALDAITDALGWPGEVTRHPRHSAPLASART